MSESDTELVRRAQGGDRPAFEELVRRTARLVYARLYLDAGDAHRAEDLVQDTFLQAFRALPELAQPERFRPWLLAIAHSALVDDARRTARKKRAGPKLSAMPPEALPDAAPPPEAAAQQDETRQQVLAALRSLPDEYRLPLTLRYLTGADAESIGRQLGLTNGSLRGLLHRGLKLLRERLPADLA